jgi:hypothetical protein
MKDKSLVGNGFSSQICQEMVLVLSQYKLILRDDGREAQEVITEPQCWLTPLSNERGNCGLEFEDYCNFPLSLLNVPIHSLFSK